LNDFVEGSGNLGALDSLLEALSTEAHHSFDKVHFGEFDDIGFEGDL